MKYNVYVHVRYYIFHTLCVLTALMYTITYIRSRYTDYHSGQVIEKKQNSKWQKKCIT